MAIKLGTPGQEKIWLLAWQARPHIGACDANRLFIEQSLDEMLLPLTVENLVGVMDAQFAIGRLAPATGAAPALKVQPVEPAPAEPEPEIDFRKMTVAALRLYLKNQTSNRKVLPQSYTKDVIRGLSMQAFERLSLEYGSGQVRDRLAGRS